jgi:hypothetical protein
MAPCLRCHGRMMNEATYRQLFQQFLHRYWGAFHEVLEAQSVTPARLAGSLFTALREEHDAFITAYEGPERDTVHALGVLWHAVAADRLERVDAPLTAQNVSAALRHFERLFNALHELGDRFPKARAEVLGAAPHGTPVGPLRADSSH